MLSHKIRNSRFHSWLCRILEKFEMEGFTLSYSQCGEDLILKTVFGKKSRNGFYVDIGCNNPIQKSNTYKLYLNGWSGLCIDGNAALIKKFKKIRKRDLCLTAIVSDTKRELLFYQDNTNHEYSSVDPSVGEELRKKNTDLTEVRTVSKTLEELFEQHRPTGAIDLLCIDVENHDLEVLKGNNFNKFRPGVICIEFDSVLNALGESEINTFLNSVGYEIFAFAAPNAYYRSVSVRAASY